MNQNIYLVRHGETNWNKQNKYQGNLNIKLNKKGRKQAKKAAEMFKNVEIDLIYSSDLDRAYETASIIADRINLEIEVMKELREMEFGNWEGKCLSAIQEESPEAYNCWINDPVKNPPPGGEKLNHFKTRAVKAFSKILSTKMKRILVVSHGGVISIYLSHILAMDSKKYRKLNVTNTGITKIIYHNQAPTLHSFNCAPHLQ